MSLKKHIDAAKVYRDETPATHKHQCAWVKLNFGPTTAAELLLEADAQLTRLRDENEQLRLSLQASAYTQIKAENDLLRRALGWLLEKRIVLRNGRPTISLGGPYDVVEVPAEFADIIKAVQP